MTTDLAALLDWIHQTGTLFLSLAGFAALFAVLINIGKVVGLVKDGDAPKWNLGLNIAGCVLMVGLGFFRGVTPAQLDGLAQSIASFLVMALTLATQLGLTPKFHTVLKAAGVPLIGYAHPA